MYTITRATTDDLLAIEQLAHRVWFAHYPGIITAKQIRYMLARDYSPDKLRHDLDAGIAIDLMNIESTPAGFAAYGPFPCETVNGDAEVKLHKLYLDPSFHGRGLGSTLLTYVERCSRKAGATRISLSVNKHNAKAISAYDRNGFSIEASVLNPIGDGFFMDDFIMAKSLR